MSVPPVDERLPVWAALSEFFLDTELDATDYERIAEALARTKYSVAELEDILRYEVYPECEGNLRDVAGEWAGFHPDWIMERIAPRKDKRPRFAMPPLHCWMFKDHWAAVSELIRGMRKG